MGFRKVKLGNTIDIKKGSINTVEGTYLGVKKIITQIGDQFIYRFQKGSGEVVGVYGFTKLNLTMESIPKGAYCRVTYLGQEECDTKFGRKPVHQCDVEIDDEKSTSVEDEGIEV